MTDYIIHNKNDLKQRLNKFEDGGNTIWDYTETCSKGLMN